MPSKEQLKRLESAPVLHEGRDQEFLKLKGCSECGGRGWFCLNPFAEYNKQYRRCPTCVEAEKHYRKHGCLPEHIQPNTK